MYKNALLLSVVTQVISVVVAVDVAVTDCSGNTPSTSVTGDTDGATGSGYSFMVEDGNFMFDCCGVVSQWDFGATSTGTLTFQVWRRISAGSFQLVSEYDHTVAGTGAQTFTPNDNERMSFKKGDYIGWYTSGAEIVKYKTGTTYPMVNRYAIAGDLASGDNFDWSSQLAYAGRWYDIQATTVASSSPYFKNLPARLDYADTAVVSSGVTVMTLTASDPDPDDASTVLMSMYPQWTQYFTFNTATGVITTARQLVPDTYYPVFMVEEQHCGKTATATLTISVTDTAPTITNLPAFYTLTEDVVAETLLHTVTVTDPTNQWIWCKGDWTIGTLPDTSKRPFIVKMISASAGTAGIYLIEWPQLDYTTTRSYELTVNCYDTADNLVTGKFYVSVTENEKPVFTNIGTSVQIDARTVITGDTLFTVSTSDSENDQVTLVSTLSDAACPFVLFNSGEVRPTSNLYLYTGATTCVMSVTASDADNTNAVNKDLTIYIINNNNSPVFTAPSGGATVNVAENTAVGTTLYTAVATDVDTSDTLTYSMSINPSRGWGMFTINSTTGVVSTHASNSINYDILGADTTYDMKIYVHDGKTSVTETLTITVTNVNEAPVFNQNWYYSVNLEGLSGASLQNPAYTVVDPDSGDTTSFTLDCGTTYSSYFSMDPATAALTYAADYSMDAGTLPGSHDCTVTVTDGGGLTATTTLAIKINHNNNNSPVFNPNTYSVSLSAGLVVGTSIAKVTATDADSSDTLSFTLTQTSLGGNYFFIQSDGTIYVAASLTTFASGGTYAVTVTATDSSANTGTATLNIEFPVSTTTVVTTTDRSWAFFEDERNVAWVALVCIFGAIFFGVVFFIVYRYLRDRTTPLINCDCLHPERFQERNKRWHVNPQGRRRPYPPSNTSHRATVSGMSSYTDDLDSDHSGEYDVDEPFQKGRVGPVLQSRPPVMVVTKAKIEEREYFDPTKKRKASRDNTDSRILTATPDTVLPSTPDSLSSETSELITPKTDASDHITRQNDLPQEKSYRFLSPKGGAKTPIRVQPSPTQLDTTENSKAKDSD